MKRVLFIFIIFICYNYCLFAQSNVRRSEYRDENGYEWVGLSSGEYKGIEDKNGNTIIPLSRQYTFIGWDSDFKYHPCDKIINGKTYSGICDKWGKEIITCNINGLIGYIGSRGFCYDDYTDGGRTKNLGVYLDSEGKAYRMNSGNKIYLSDGTNGTSSSSISINKIKWGRVESVWFDHDVYLNGQKGMKIHSKMNINGYKGQSFKMRVCHFFYYEDGRKLWGNTSGYTTNNRDQVVACIEDRVTPTWDETTYNDWWVFIPYTALHCNSSCTLKISSVLMDVSSDNWLGDDAYVTYINYNTGNAPVYNQPVAQNPFYYPIPKFDFSNVKFDFSNINSTVPMQSSGAGGYGGAYSGGNEAGGGTGNTPRQLITKTCGVCHGTGKCNNCVNGWVTRMGMGKDGPCPVCPNHNGLCSSCGGRGTWKE